MSEPDDAQIENLAREIYLEKARREQSAHGQHIVPWEELGETFKVSLRQMAKDKLK